MNVADVPSVTTTLSAAMEISGVAGVADSAVGQEAFSPTIVRVTIWPAVQVVELAPATVILRFGFCPRNGL